MVVDVIAGQVREGRHLEPETVHAILVQRV